MMDVELSDIGGLEASRQIDNKGLCPIILLSASGDLTLVREACSISAVQTFLVKPVCEENLQPAIGLAIARHSQMEELAQLSRRKAELET
jgi:response regulator NasT